MLTDLEVIIIDKTLKNFIIILFEILIIGTGKTFLYNTILAKIRSEGKIAIAVATSGIAASLLDGGVTAHSIFRIPLKVDNDSTCNIPVDSDLAKMIQKLI